MSTQETHNTTQSLRQTFESAAGKPARPVGRKASSKSAPRITLRLSIEEDEKLKELSSGMAVSAYVRDQLFGSNVSRRKRRSHVPVKDQAAMSQALGLLGKTRIANNLNQLAHHANTGSLLIDDETLRQIDDAYSHVMAMRNSLIRALGLIDGE